jgi:hypothetical protein
MMTPFHFEGTARALTEAAAETYFRSVQPCGNDRGLLNEKTAVDGTHPAVSLSETSGEPAGAVRAEKKAPPRRSIAGVSCSWACAANEEPRAHTPHPRAKH